MKLIVSAIVTLSLCAPLFAGDVIISEIMYNPDSNEGYGGGDNPQPCKTEWVEVYNTSDAEVDLSGWTLADEDGKTGPIADGTKLAAGAALVIIPVECGVDKFKEAWGDDIQIVEVTGWSADGMYQLANTPSDINEILLLKDTDDATVDGVNFDDEAGWPTDEPDGPSIYLKPDALDAVKNDTGSNWARSTGDTHGAKGNKQNDVFTGRDTGSPGTVATE